MQSKFVAVPFPTSSWTPPDVALVLLLGSRCVPSPHCSQDSRQPGENLVLLFPLWVLLPRPAATGTLAMSHAGAESRQVLQRCCLAIYISNLFASDGRKEQGYNAALWAAGKKTYSLQQTWKGKGCDVCSQPKGQSLIKFPLIFIFC